MLQKKTHTNIIPGFSAQELATITDLNPGLPIDYNKAEPLVRELSAVFREFLGVATSAVSADATEETTRYTKSEGTSFVRSGF